VAYCAVIFWWSSRSKLPDLASLFPMQDKAMHAGVYAGLAGLVSLGIRRSHDRVHPVAQFLIPVLFVLLYGISDEFHQWFVPGRSCDVADLGADMAGALAFQWILCFYVWRPPQSRPSAQL
jgi:VanZ family protein